MASTSGHRIATSRKTLFSRAYVSRYMVGYDDLDDYGFLE